MSLCTQVVRALLAAGADVHLPWASGSLAGASPLQTAASVGHVEVLKLLIGRPQTAVRLHWQCIDAL
jgi:ankyrin repeat protein